MLLALLLAAADPWEAMDAERAFNAAAQANGQWTAFRQFAADDALMLVPQPVNAQAWLKDRADPPRSVEWWPTRSYVSCDGNFAVNTGGWQRPDGSVGYFTTLWQRQGDGSWKWVLDHGDTLKTPRPEPEQPEVIRANCDTSIVVTSTPDIAAGTKLINGLSPDGSIGWILAVAPDGARRLWIHAGDTAPVIYDEVAAPK